MTRVLVVEDESALRHALSRNLTARGYDVDEAADGGTAITRVTEQSYDVVILDLGLPDVDGVEVIRATRKAGDTPIVVLSARTGSTDKIEALDLGADDFVTKPFDVEELLARLRAVARRSTEGAAGTRFELGDVAIDLSTTTAIRTLPDGAEERIRLTPNEWQLLSALLRNPGRLVTTRQLLTAMRGSAGHTDPSYLRIYVGQLRRKLEKEPSRPRHLLTELGLGYRYQP